MASDSVETFPLTDELTVRVYAGSDLEQSHTFYFDFFHNQKGPIQKPSDVRVYTQEDGKTVEVLSIFDSLKQSTEGAQWVMKAGEDNLEGKTFIIPEGTLLRIVYSNDQSCLLRIPIRGQASAVWR